LNGLLASNYSGVTFSLHKRYIDCSVHDKQFHVTVGQKEGSLMLIIQTTDVLLASLWGLGTACIMAPIMMLGRAYQASHVNYYHHRGHHMLERQDHLKHVRLYAFMAAAALLLLGVYLFIL
jgi:hypothetical protein